MNVYLVTEKWYRNGSLYDAKTVSVFKTLDLAKKYVMNTYTDGDYLRLNELNTNSGYWGNIKAVYEHVFKLGYYVAIIVYEHTLQES